MKPDFKKGNGLVPAIIQHAYTGQVLMLGYMNDEAFRQTQETGKVTFFSRSKERLWTKGETSGHFLNVVDVSIDCDADTLLIRVEPEGPVCHEGTESCFGDKRHEGFVHILESIIRDRKDNPTDKSYTATLFERGINRIAQKVGEEATEVIIEAKDDDIVKFREEVADLIYHLLVLITQKDTTIREVEDVLIARHKR